MRNFIKMALIAFKFSFGIIDAIEASEEISRVDF